ncbi:MAG: hypothetical protein IPH54_04840 [Rhodoferax sp.]|nr:hypothetical protein [Rhodoferax sp.]
MALYPKPYGSLKMLQKQELLAHVERAVEAYFVVRKAGKINVETKTCG